MRNFALAFAAFLVPGMAILVFGSSGAAAAGDAGQVPTLAQNALITQGNQLYQETCSSCHGASGQGSFQDGVHIPQIVGLGPAFYDFMLTTGRMPLADPRAQMIPKTPLLTSAQIHAITAFLTSLAPGQGVPIPHVDAAAGNLSQGQQLFVTNCAPCHGPTGAGGAVGPMDAPNLRVATPTQIGEAMRIGPGTMPVFSAGTLDQQQLNSLVRYVLYLRHPDNAGGAGLGGFGPIVEGFVGLFLGLGVLVLVNRYIGARS